MQIAIPLHQERARSVPNAAGQNDIYKNRPGCCWQVLSRAPVFRAGSRSLRRSETSQPSGRGIAAGDNHSVLNCGA
jgi:hypothetical protein